MPSDAMPTYQVLARKYRPETFADLVGQDAMVRTLKNAFAADRIAQAFIMTGIRGTGKTTTARIIAKGLNCVGPDGAGGPTTEPCGRCEHCVAIAEGRHVGPPVPSGPTQFRPLAMIRAVVVLPVPRMPVMMKACAIRSAAKAFFSVRTIASWPTRSAKVSGRYLRART